VLTWWCRLRARVLAVPAFMRPRARVRASVCHRASVRVVSQHTTLCLWSSLQRVEDRDLIYARLEATTRDTFFNMVDRRTFALVPQNLDGQAD
jgi:hypothetical protein